MKILKIDLKNINSLKSDKIISIDFESEAFRDVGLFAITGVTGSGKSTILDAITIALYQEVPRLNPSNIKANLEDVVSLGAQEAYASVLFEVKAERYEASWSMRLYSKTGKKLANAKEQVRLKNISKAKILAEKKTEFKQAIIEITQLTYQQFLRSVLLAQGEFASFLSANNKEKGALLEQITGEDIYKKIGELLIQHRYKENAKLEEIKSKINQEDLLSEEEEKLLKEEQTKVQQELQNLQKELQENEEVLLWFKNHRDLKSKKERYQKEWLQYQEKKEAFQDDKMRLEQHKKAIPFIHLITRLKEKEAEKIKTLSQIKEAEECQADLRESKIKDEQALKQEENKYLNAEKQYKEAQPFIDQLTQLDATIEEEKKIKSKYLEQRKTLKLQIKKCRIAQKNTKEEALILEDNILKLSHLLEEKKFYTEIESHLDTWNKDLNQRWSDYQNKEDKQLKIKKNKDILIELKKQKEDAFPIYSKKKSSIEKLIKELENTEKEISSFPKISDLYDKKASTQSQIDQWGYLIEIAESVQEIFQKQTTAQSDVKQLNTETPLLKDHLKSAFYSMEQAEKSWLDSQEKERLHNKIINLEQERKNLKRGQACPLCGSENHPFSEHIPDNDTTYKNEIEERLKIYKKQQQAHQELLKQESEHQNNIQRLQDKIAEWDKHINQQKELFNNKLKLICAEEYSIEEIEALTSIQQNKKQQLNNYIKDIAILEPLTERKQDIQNQIDKESTSLQTLEQKIQKWEADIEHYQQINADLDSEVQVLQTQIKKVETRLTNHFKTFVFDVPPVEETESFSNNLRKGVSNYNKKREHLKALKSDKELKTQEQKTEQLRLQEYDANLLELNKEITEKRTSFKKNISTRKALLPLDKSPKSYRKNLENLKNEAQQLYEKQKVEVQNKEKKLDLLEQDLKHYKEQQNKIIAFISEKSTLLEQQIQDSTFNSSEEIENNILKEEIENQFNKTIEELQKKEATLKRLNEDLTKESHLLKEQKKSDKTEIEAQNDVQFQTIEKEKKLKRIGEIEEKFRLNQGIKNRNQEVYLAIKQQEKELAKWQRLLSVLGGSSHAFNTYVQRLTLKNLIDLANIHLRKLNARYTLVMEEKYKPGEELDFKMIDHYLADELRYIDTSSGGEKFLISLALALGLSDLSSHQVQIDSLFIDEGFGTLDNRTLDMVLANLQTLQAQGKMIGIISHVENLKERIPTQIALHKQSNGVSTLKINS